MDVACCDELTSVYIIPKAGGFVDSPALFVLEDESACAACVR